MRILAIGVPIAVLLTGCAATPEPREVVSLNSPVNAHSGIRNSNYSNVIGDYHHREPVEPKPWRKLNDDQAPREGSGS